MTRIRLYIYIVQLLFYTYTEEDRKKYMIYNYARDSWRCEFLLTFSPVSVCVFDSARFEVCDINMIYASCWSRLTNYEKEPRQVQ